LVHAFNGAERRRKAYPALLIAVACAVFSGEGEARERTGSTGAATARFRPLIPYPRPRPGEPPPNVGAPSATTKPDSEGPSECLQRLKDIAVVRALPAIEGPGACGAVDVVRLEAVLTADARRVALNPPAVFRCRMAEAVVRWIRDEAAPLVAQRGSPIASLTTAASFECRGRNRVTGAQLSQHGLANALDVRAFTLADGKALTFTDPSVAKDLRLRLQESACAHFSTVLGPGSDGYHEDHIHLDLAERRSGYRLCQWAVRDPAEAAAVAAAAAAKAAAKTLPKFTPLAHQDGGAAGAIAPLPPEPRRKRADRSASCRADRECPRGSLHPPTAAPPRRAAR
jgi:hypothetical protein